MSSGFEQYHHDRDVAATAGQHRSQLGLTRCLEGRLVSTRDYRNNVARDNARVHYGDQHHHYYARQGEDPEMRNDPMQQLRDALSFPRRHYRLTTIEPAYRQTCQWLFEAPEYTRWRDWDSRRVHNGILWLKGKPGAGKSTVTKCALEQANAIYPNEHNIYFFFNARGEKLEKCTEGMFRSLLHQVAQHVPWLLEVVDVEAAATHARTGWPVDLLKSLFREAALQLASKAQLNCYIDALDEGEDEDQIRDMVAFFEELSEIAVSEDIRLLTYFASRHYPHISIRLSEEIMLDDYAGHHSDIASYVRNKLTCSQPALKEELVTEIIHRSSGVFLWVVLVVRVLNMESDRGNQHRLRTCLQATPKGLNDLFSGIVGDGDMDGTLLPTLLWVLFAKRSLSPLELYFAVVHCTNPYAPSSVVWDLATVDETSVKNFITSNSRGLLEIVVSTSHTMDLLPNGGRSYGTSDDLVVQFIHESVREYLLESSLQRLDPSLTGDLVGISNFRLARWCQSYVELSSQHGAFSPFERIDADTTLPLLPRLEEAAPFSQYALIEILYHSEKAASHGLEIPIPFEDCLHTHLPLSVALIERRGSQPRLKKSKPTTLHALAMRGYVSLMFELLQRYDQTARQSYIDLRIEGGAEHHMVALHLAVRHGNFNTVQMLLEHGADVSACDGHGKVVLLYAAEFGIREMIETVLDHGADTNARDQWGKTALHLSIEAGNLDAFESLIRHGADANARDKQGKTPLHCSVETGNLRFSKALGRYGAGKFHNYGGDTPTMSWIRSAQPAMLETLLAHAADINVKDENGFTPLYYAVFSKEPLNTGILRILLQNGADTNFRVKDVEPLLTAVVRKLTSSVEVAQVLLRNGADVDTTDYNGRTALHVAVERHHTVAIKPLYEYNEDMAALDDEYGTTPLLLAIPPARTSGTEVIEMLLKHGANVNAVNRSSSTVLRIAVESGNVELITMLLIYGADVYSQKEGYVSIMEIAYGDSNESIARLLTHFAEIQPCARFTAARALEHQEWWKRYIRRRQLCVELSDSGEDSNSE
jgi:ankyrin repeat protein